MKVRLLLTLLVLFTTGFAQETNSPSHLLKISPEIAAPGQFVNFSWGAADAASITVSPSILSEDEDALPLSSQMHPVVAPPTSTVYVATTRGNNPSSTRVRLTVVPVMASADRTAVPEGQSVNIRYVGPNNGSKYQMIELPGNIPTELTPSCAGAVCGGTYTVKAIRASGRFQLRVEGPAGGMSFSQQLPVSVDGRPEALSSPMASPAPSSGTVQSLRHIIFMLQENRSFDNYFGKLGAYRASRITGAKATDVDDLDSAKAQYALKNPQGQSFKPFHQRTECIENLSPSWDESHTDMHLVGGNYMNVSASSKYKMDGFLKTTKSGGTGDVHDATHTRPIGYYNETDLPFYYELATQFATSDRWYSPIPANTIPNRMYLFAGTSYGNAYPPTDNMTYQRPTFFRALTNAGVSWRYYYLDNSVFLANWTDWTALKGHVYPIQDWFNVLGSPNADQQLPQVIFIERASSTGLDEHPSNNVQKGASAVEQLLRALFTSAVWPSSAFILSYDEGGGTLDHVKPILVTPPDNIAPRDITGHVQGLFNLTGFRVPMVVISPWVKPHYVSHLPMDYIAILRFIEKRFNVPSLTMRDSTAGNMNDFFDFSSPHMLTVPTLPPQPTNGACDFKLESWF